MRSATNSQPIEIKGPRFGSHLSVAAGLENAIKSAAALGFDCTQLFVKNQRQWRAAPLTDEAVARFDEARRSHSVTPIVAHASYLINLASPDGTLRRKSEDALLDEVERCDRLGVCDLVLHPGAALGDTELAAITQIARGLDEIDRRRSRRGVRILLECTAGQGSSIGHRLEHLADIRAQLREPRSIGVCLDTCHLFAAGYDFRSAEAYQTLMAELEKTVGLESIHCIHVNDSKRELGSRVDRHEHIGKGKIGKAGFTNFVNDPRWVGIPMILETPKGTDARGIDFDKTNLKRLRSLIC